MRRFEFEEAGSKKFWQCSVEGTELKVTYGRIGTGGQTKVKSFASVEAAEKEVAKLVREKTGKGYVAVSEASSSPLPAAEKPFSMARVPASAGFEGIPMRTLKGLATKLAKVRSNDMTRYEELLYQSVRPELFGPVFWHLVDAELLVAEESLGYLLLLSKYAAAASTDSLFALLARIPASFPPPRDFQFLPSWFVGLDRLAVEAVRRDPARVLALLPTLPTHIRLGLQLVRGRSGMAVVEADKRAVLLGLAQMQADMEDLVQALERRELWRVQGEALEPLVIGNVADVRSLALCFGSAEEWGDALLAAVRRDRWGSVRAVADALRVLPLEELAELPAERWRATPDEDFFALLTARADAPSAIFEVLDALEPERVPSNNDLRDKFRVYAIVTLGERNEPIPEGAEETLLSLPFLYCRYNDSKLVLRDWCARAIGALPAPRAEAVLEKFIAKLPDLRPELERHFPSQLAPATNTEPLDAPQASTLMPHATAVLELQGDAQVPWFGPDEAVHAMVLVGQTLAECDVEMDDAEAEIARLAKAHGVPLVLINFPFEGAIVGLVAGSASAAGRCAVEVSKEAFHRAPSQALWAEVSRIFGGTLAAPSLWLAASGARAQAHLVEEAKAGSEFYGQDMDQLPWETAVVGNEIAVANFEGPWEPIDGDVVSHAEGRLLLVARYD